MERSRRYDATHMASAIVVPAAGKARFDVRSEWTIAPSADGKTARVALALVAVSPEADDDDNGPKTPIAGAHVQLALLNSYPTRVAFADGSTEMNVVTDARGAAAADITSSAGTEYEIRASATFSDGKSIGRPVFYRVSAGR